MAMACCDLNARNHKQSVSVLRGVRLGRGDVRIVVMVGDREKRNLLTHGTVYDLFDRHV
jgi:hypothetical protein